MTLVAIIIGTLIILFLIGCVGVWAENLDLDFAKYTYVEFKRRGGRLYGDHCYIGEHEVRLPYFGYLRLMAEDVIQTITDCNRRSRKAREEIEKEVFGE